MNPYITAGLIYLALFALWFGWMLWTAEEEPEENKEDAAAHNRN